MGALVEVRVNARNAVFLLPYFVVKYRRDWNLRRAFNEYCLCWKAFLNGVAPFCICIPPFLVLERVRGRKLKCLEHIPVGRILKAVYALTRAGIQHGEIKHPENHIFVGNRVYIIDYDKGKLSKNPRNLSKVVGYLSRRAGREIVFDVLNSLPCEDDVRNALRFLEHDGGVADDG